MDSDDGSARSSPPDGSNGNRRRSRLDPSSFRQRQQQSVIQNIMLLHCDSLRCCLLARDVSDIVPYHSPSVGTMSVTTDDLAPRYRSLPLCSLANLLDPEELRQVGSLVTRPGHAVNAHARSYLVLLEKGPGALALVASRVKLVLGVNLDRVCRPAPSRPGLGKLALAWLEIAGVEMPLLSVEALLWRHRTRATWPLLLPGALPVA